MSATKENFKSAPKENIIGTPDAEAVNKAEARTSLYAKRKKVYPRRVYGLFRRLKWAVMAFAFLIYYGLPWLRYSRPDGLPDQAFLIDMSAGKAYFFGIEIWAQEIYFATGLLILAALILFFSTSLAGRLWCGYACPQTVWTDLFIHVERWIQGDRAARIKLDRAPWGLRKIFLKTATHSAWLLISLFTGGVMILYFHDAPSTVPVFFTGGASATAYIFAGLLTFTTYLLGGIAREQFCIYMCPWPRIQGALIDDKSLLVSYDKKRGEPRAKYRKGEDFSGRGSCIDCGQCVAVCPMGIDIRDGFQLECIQCALCVDACNDVMAKIGAPLDLIRYAAFSPPVKKTTPHAKGLKRLLAFWRPRLTLYVMLITLVSSIMLYGLIARRDFDFHIRKDRSPLFVTLSSGDIRDGYDLHLLNKQQSARMVTIRLAESDLAADDLRLQGLDGVERTQISFLLPVDDGFDIRLFAVLKRAALQKNALINGQRQIKWVIEDQDGAEIDSKESLFHGPR